MPYVSPEEALNLPAVDLDALGRTMGPPPWRRPLVSTAATRCVVLAWPEGCVARAHRHPRAEETFYVLRGRGLFRFGGDPSDHPAGPGTLLFARRGVQHMITVVGPEPLLLLVSVTPNEDAPDETIEDDQPPADLSRPR